MTSAEIKIKNFENPGWHLKETFSAALHDRDTFDPERLNIPEYTNSQANIKWLDSARRRSSMVAVIDIQAPEPYVDLGYGTHNELILWNGDVNILENRYGISSVNTRYNSDSELDYYDSLKDIVKTYRHKVAEKKNALKYDGNAAATPGHEADLAHYQGMLTEIHRLYICFKQAGLT